MEMTSALIGIIMRAWHRYKSEDTEIAPVGWELYQIRCGLPQALTGETMLQRIVHRVSGPESFNIA